MKLWITALVNVLFLEWMQRVHVLNCQALVHKIPLPLLPKPEGHCQSKQDKKETCKCWKFAIMIIVFEINSFIKLKAFLFLCFNGPHLSSKCRFSNISSKYWVNLDPSGLFHDLGRPSVSLVHIWPSFSLGVLQKGCVHTLSDWMRNVRLAVNRWCILTRPPG